MNDVLNFLSETIFAGACSVTLLSIIIYAARRKNPINRSALTQAINITLLSGATLNLIFFILTCIGVSRGTEYDRYIFFNRYLGPYWYAGCFILVSWTLLPQVFWFRKVRLSSTWSIIILGVQLLFKLMLLLVQLEVILGRGDSTWTILPTISFVDYFEHMGAYLIIIITLYYLLSRFRITSHSSSAQ